MMLYINNLYKSWKIVIKFARVYNKRLSLLPGFGANIKLFCYI